MISYFMFDCSRFFAASCSDSPHSEDVVTDEIVDCQDQRAIGSLPGNVLHKQVDEYHRSSNFMLRPTMLSADCHKFHTSGLLSVPSVLIDNLKVSQFYSWLWDCCLL